MPINRYEWNAITLTQAIYLHDVSLSVPIYQMTRVPTPPDYHLSPRNVTSIVLTHDMGIKEICSSQEGSREADH